MAERTGMGGAVACRNTSDFGTITIQDCVFRNNIAEPTIVYQSGHGGAILLSYGGVLTLTRCTFVGNSTTVGLGGALLTEGMLPDDTWKWTRIDMMDCVFVGNSAGWGGAWHPAAKTEALVGNCIFVGNKAAFGSGQGIGGAVMVNSADTEWYNCLFAGNSALHRGGALMCGEVYDVPNTVSLFNCALLDNHAGDSGGGMRTWGSDLIRCDLQNCVAWGNAPDQLVDNTASQLMTVTYSDVQDGTGELWFGTGCIDADPLFVGGPSGTWTSDGAYEDSTGMTTFTDSGASWDPSELVDKFLRPNVEYEPADPNDPSEPSGYFQSLIVSNTATTVTVWGDFEALGTTGATYQVNDYHVLPDSPVIDAGDNTAVPPDELDLDRDGDVTERIPLDLDSIRRFTDRPATTDTGVADEPNYPQVVDMGPYEYGTFGDLDGDCSVGLADLAQLLASYGATVGPGYDHGDLDLDEDVDLSDLAALLGVYGITCP
jgi:predicted outer membrane repeat protein